MQIISIIAYLIQYKEINYRIFFLYPYYLKSFSHIAEMMPIAVTGLTLKNIDIIKKLENKRIKCISYSMIAIFLIYTLFLYFSKSNEKMNIIFY